MSSTKSVFWVGVVEDRKDPLQLGRVRVRIHGYHSPLKKDIPTDHLPWSLVAMPTTSASTSGVGSMNGLVPGTWVLGIWNEDGEQFQNSVVIATIPGMIPQEDKPTSIDLLQQNTRKSFYQENYGDAFRDPRTEEELKNEPTNKFKKKKFPDGKDKDGDKHGAQLENDKAEKFPRSNSYSCVPYNDGKMTDIAIWQDEYRPDVAQQALAWLRDLKAWAQTDNEPPAPELRQTFCKDYCPYFDPSGEIGCPSTMK